MCFEIPQMYLFCSEYGRIVTAMGGIYHNTYLFIRAIKVTSNF
jgi:hypothetical protein